MSIVIPVSYEQLTIQQSEALQIIGNGIQNHIHFKRIKLGNCAAYNGPLD